MSGCIALLLSVLSVTLFCPAVEEDVYQAEENSNITMTWLLHFNTNRPPDIMLIDLMNVKRRTRIFFYDRDRDTETYPDEFYRGRLQCDPQLTRKGEFKCLLTDLRLSDTGTYDCIVVLDGESSFKTFDLSVTAAAEKPTGETPKPGSRERIGLCAALGVFVVVVLALFVWSQLYTLILHIIRSVLL